MKTKFICLLLPLVLLGCSKKQPQVPARQTSAGSLPEITVVESPEKLEQKQIEKQALALFNDKDYEQLEALAAKYRASKEKYADGSWKLAWVYTGLELSDDDGDAVWQDREKQIRDWVQARPQSVMARVELGRFLTDYGWKARGSGWASTVKEEGWQIFGQRLQMAAQVLAKAGQLDEKCPVYWSALQKVALGLQLDRTRYNNIFNAAIKEFPDYQYYYRSRAVFLLPRWYGDDGETERDLEKSADRIGGEAGDMIYAQVVWDLHDYGCPTNVFKENSLSWERTDRGFEVILKNFPDSLAAKNEAAHLAALARDPAKALKYFLLTKGQVDVSQWDDKDQFVNCYKWALGQ
ncbi:MAG: DUF4034 domain-containing protein [Limisphaerales bacterium]